MSTLTAQDYYQTKIHCLTAAAKHLTVHKPS